MSSTASDLPPLRQISFQDLHSDDIPRNKIRTDEDVLTWKTTRGYQDFGLFLRRLKEAVVGYMLPWTEPMGETTVAMITLLDTLDGWIDEIPPLPTPQRFGNLAFRTWGKRLETEAEAVLAALLPASLHSAIPLLTPYLLTSYGSFTRMDYGTGHEASFALLLLCLTLIRFFVPEPRYERELVLCVFVRYLRLCWRLQDVYKLEPAGSHGVWGLDDSSFLGYIFGSAQLRDQSEIPVSAILHPPLPPTNLYFMSIMRIYEVKHGPFHEHSSQLYSIAVGVQFWAKVNSGLFKMYEAEVLGKRVVVQHIPLGGLLAWDTPIDAYQEKSSGKPPILSSSHAPVGGVSVTHAPWLSPVASNETRTGYTPHTSSSLPAAAPHNLNNIPLRDVHSHHERRIEGDTFLSARLPLGPTASTSLRPRGNPMRPSAPPSSDPDTKGNFDSAHR